MKLDKFLAIFKDLDPNTEITIPELKIWNPRGYIQELSKVELNLELFKIKDRQYENNIARMRIQNSRYFWIMIVLIIIICILVLIIRHKVGC